MRIPELCPEPPLEPPEPKIIGYCKVCGGEVYENNYWFEDDCGRLVHNYDECLDDLWDELTTFEKADFLGLERR